jgi:hypothetical protein
MANAHGTFIEWSGIKSIHKDEHKKVEKNGIKRKR